MATVLRWRSREVGIGWKERRGRADGNSYNDYTTVVDKSMIFAAVGETTVALKHQFFLNFFYRTLEIASGENDHRL